MATNGENKNVEQGKAPDAVDFANYFCTYGYLYHQKGARRKDAAAGARSATQSMPTPDAVQRCSRTTSEQALTTRR